MSCPPAPRIHQLLEAAAQTEPDRLAFVSPQIKLTRLQVLNLARSYARRLRENGVKSGDTVAVRTDDGLIAAVCAFSLSIVRALYLPYADDLLLGRAPTVDWVLRSPDQPRTKTILDITIEDDWSPRFTEAWVNPNDRRADSDTDITWISPSAGTTGRAKYGAVSTRLLARRLAAIAKDYQIASKRVMILFPGGSRPYIIRAVSALAYGNVLIDAMSPEDTVNSEVAIICASPQQIRLWLGGRTLKPRIPLLQVSGARINDSLVARLLESFEAVEDVYGSNETIKSHINRYELSEQDERRICARGFATGADLAIFDAQGPVRAIGEEGELRVRSEFAVNGYLNDPDGTASHFRDGWFITGDRAVWGENGLLQILGRKGDMANIEGRKIELTDFENQLSELEGVLALSCFDVAEINDAPARLAACVVPRAGTDKRSLATMLMRRATELLGPGMTVSTILFVRDLAKTPDGVIRRSAARNHFNEVFREKKTEISDQDLFRYEPAANE